MLCVWIIYTTRFKKILIYLLRRGNNGVAKKRNKQSIFKNAFRVYVRNNKIYLRTSITENVKNAGILEKKLSWRGKG